ncbi:hypothetical protein ISCGN_025214 [Ixodes scapularis]
MAVRTGCHSSHSIFAVFLLLSLVTYRASTCISPPNSVGLRGLGLCASTASDASYARCLNGPGAAVRLKGLTTPRWRHFAACLLFCLSTEWLVDATVLPSGDVASNPGPQHITCTRCTKRVLDCQAALCCDACDRWSHRACVYVSLPEYRKLSSSNDLWYCLGCSLPPFADDLFDLPVASMIQPLTVPTPVATGRSPGGGRKVTMFWYGNCRSFRNKVVDLQAHVSSFPPGSVVLLTETWLDVGVADSELFDTNAYTVFRKDSTVLVGCVYYPPSIREESYRLLEVSLRAASLRNYENILVFGDFNSHIDWFTHEEPVPRDRSDDFLLDIASSAGLTQACAGSTYSARDGTSSFLDLLFVVDPTRIVSCETSEGLPDSDHLAIEVTYAAVLPQCVVSFRICQAQSWPISRLTISSLADISVDDFPAEWVQQRLDVMARLSESRGREEPQATAAGQPLAASSIRLRPVAPAGADGGETSGGGLPDPALVVQYVQGSCRQRSQLTLSGVSLRFRGGEDGEAAWLAFPKSTKEKFSKAFPMGYSGPAEEVALAAMACLKRLGGNIIPPDLLVPVTAARFLAQWGAWSLRTSVWTMRVGK